MAKTIFRSAKEPISKSASPALDGNSIHNEILLTLSAKERETVPSELEFAEMRNGDLLNELGAPIEYCYFLNRGLASIPNVLSDGKSKSD